MGITNELFWELAIPEIEAVVDLYLESERAKTLRAGLVAATIQNVHRARGVPLVQPKDFLPAPREYLTPEQAAAFMDRWAEMMNQEMGVSDGH